MLLYYIPVQDMVVEQEYLIHDFVSMLGSIGGTLGMFIGFSFLGIFLSSMGWLQKLVEYFFDRKIFPTSENIIVVKEANENAPKEDRFDSNLNGAGEYVTEFKKLEDKMNQVLQSLEELSKN